MNINSKGKEDFEDYPLSEVPLNRRKGFWSLSLVLLGFTYFSATMWAGGNLGLGFKFFPDLVLIILAGNLLLGLYVAILGFIAYKSGLNTVLLTRFSLGQYGSKFSDLLLGLTQIGWYAWGTATISVVFIKLFMIDAYYTNFLMILLGGLFSITAFIGYKGLEKLSVFAVPLMTILIIVSIAISFIKAKELGGVLSLIPADNLSVGMGITIVFGTFVSGGTQSTNWTRFASSSKSAIFSSLIAFFIGNGLMIFIGAMGALVYHNSEISEVLKMQGLAVLGIIMIVLNIWTTQDNTIYNFSVAGCNFFRTEKRRLFTVLGAALGIVLAVAGMYDWLVPYLVLLGTIIPPLGGIIMADFFIKHRGFYPLVNTHNVKFNYIGIVSYFIASITAYSLDFIPPLMGIIVSFVAYSVLNFAYNKYITNKSKE